MTETPWTVLQRRLLSRYDDLKIRLTRYLGSTELANDALQDTWLRLERGGEISSVQSPDSYLFRVAVNIARDHLRAENRRLTTTEVEVLLNIADEAPDAEQILESRSDLEALKMVMAELPARQRAILVAARLEKNATKRYCSTFRRFSPLCSAGIAGGPGLLCVSFANSGDHAVQIDTPRNVSNERAYRGYRSKNNTARD